MIIFDFWTHINNMEIDTTSVELTIVTIVGVNPLIVYGLKVMVSLSNQTKV